MDVGPAVPDFAGEDKATADALQRPEVRSLTEQLQSGVITRASFLRRVGVLGLGMGVTASLLAACGGGGSGSTAAATTSTTETSSGGGAVADKYKGKTI